MQPSSAPGIANLREASRAVVRELGFLQEPMACVGLGRAECHALIEVERGAAGTAGDLARLLVLDKSNASRTVAALLEAGLVEARADPADRRRRLLALTPAGRRKMGEIHALADGQVGRALATLEPAERGTVVEGMRLYARALERARRQAGFELRPIARRDDPAVAALIRTVMPEFGACGPGFAINDPEVDAMSAAYRGPRAGYYVVTEGGRVVGGGGFARLAGGGERVCELRKMYFLPEVRGAGMGRRLLRHVLDAARASGFRVCYLETLRTMVQARGLYESEGFERLASPMGGTGHFGCDAWYAKELAATGGRGRRVRTEGRRKRGEGTALDIPEDVMEEAKRALGFKSKTDVVIAALRELVRRRRIDELEELPGEIEIEVDLARSRGRPRRTSR